jgi:hypothetical protein
VLWDEYRRSFASSHVFWHTLWCSLGEFPNPLQFTWSDHNAMLRANELAGRPVPWLTQEYESTLFLLWLH